MPKLHPVVAEVTARGSDGALMGMCGLIKRDSLPEVDVADLLGRERVALEQANRVDALFVDRASVKISDRVRLLAADEGPEADVAPTAEGVTRLLELLRTRLFDMERQRREGFLAIVLTVLATVGVILAAVYLLRALHERLERGRDRGAADPEGSGQLTAEAEVALQVGDEGLLVAASSDLGLFEDGQALGGAGLFVLFGLIDDGGRVGEAGARGASG